MDCRRWQDGQIFFWMSLFFCRYKPKVQENHRILDSLENKLNSSLATFDPICEFTPPIKLIRTNSELFKTEAINACLNSHTQGCIELESCAPYEHGQLGNVERFHRTFQDCTNKTLYGKPHLS